MRKKISSEYLINKLINENNDDWIKKTQERNRQREHPPGGIYNKSAEEIVEYLLKDSDNPTQALRRITFYINRAGKNLPPDRRRELEKAKRILQSKSSQNKVNESASPNLKPVIKKIIKKIAKKSTNKIKDNIRLKKKKRK